MMVNHSSSNDVEHSTPLNLPALSRRQIRQAKEARQREEAAIKREAKGKAKEKEKSQLSNNSQSNDLTSLDGSGSADHGNFHNYYKFNPSEERAKLVPLLLYQSIINQHHQNYIQEQETKQDYDREVIETSNFLPSTSTFSRSPLNFLNSGNIYPLSLIDASKTCFSTQPLLSSGRLSLFFLDLGCNEGDLTLSIVDKMIHECENFCNKLSDHIYSGVDIYVVAVDIDGQLIQRAREKNTKYCPVSQSSINLSQIDKLPFVRAQVCFYVADLFDPSVISILIDRFLPSGYQYSCIFAFALLMWLDLHIPKGSNWLQLFIQALSKVTSNFIIEYQPIRCYHNAIERRRRSGKTDFIGWSAGETRKSMRERVNEWLHEDKWKESNSTRYNNGDTNQANKDVFNREEMSDMEPVIGVTRWGRDVVWLMKCSLIRPADSKAGSQLIGIEPNPGPMSSPPLTSNDSSFVNNRLHSPSKMKHRSFLSKMCTFGLLLLFLLSAAVCCIFFVLNLSILISRKEYNGPITQIWQIFHSSSLPQSNSLISTQSNPNSITIPLPLLYSSPHVPLSSSRSSILSSSSPLYTSHHCIGDRGRLHTEGERSCHFQNLCLHYNDDGTYEWQYWQDPAKVSYPFVLDEGVIYNELPSIWLNLRSMGREQDAKYWGPTLKKSETGIPKQFFKFSAHEQPLNQTRMSFVYSDELILFYHPHYPSNLGHILGDDLFPLFQLMASYNLLIDDPYLFVSRNCEDIFLNDDGWKRDKCKELMVTLPVGLTHNPVIFLSSPDSTLQLGIESVSSSPTICYSHVLAGLPPFGFQQSWGKAPMWQAYRRHYLTHFKLSPTRTPRKQKVVISLKEGRRDIANGGLVLAYLQMNFPTVDISAVNIWKSSNGWKNELIFLSDVTVLITPCGGVSMSAMFLPIGAAMIVVDYWNVAANKSVGMEEKLWSNLGYVRPFHYPFIKDEVELDSNLNRDGHYDMREFGRVRVDVERMAVLVKAALKHVEEFMEWGRD